MRVTNQQLHETLLTGIRQQLEIQVRGNAQISSGKRFQRPAQAALDYKISLDIRHMQSGIESSLSAINTAGTRLKASMNVLNGMNQLLVRAQTLAIQEASAQVSAPERQTAAVEVSHLKDQLLGFANQRLDEQSLFAGTAVSQDAFAVDSAGNITYNGNTTDRIVAITSAQSVVSNVRGDHAALAQAFTSIQALEAALQTNNAPGIQSALGQLNTAGNAMTDLTAEVGSRVNSLNLRQTSFQDLQFTLEKRLNSHEGVDIAATISQLQESSVALQASYSQIAALRSLSLVNFLR